MKSEYYPPTFESKQFHCPICGVFAHQIWSAIFVHEGSFTGIPWKACRCTHCGDRSYWYMGRMMVPSEASVPPAHADLPEDCKLEYDEARDIVARSPRAAAALLRLCIQKMMPHLGEKGDNINSDIKSLVSKGLPVLVQKALDFCRVIGNNSVHPGEIEINDTPQVAQKLFQMINFIVQDRITHPKEIESLYSELPESDKEAIDNRDGKIKL